MKKNDQEMKRKGKGEEKSGLSSFLHSNNVLCKYATSDVKLIVPNELMPLLIMVKAETKCLKINSFQDN